MKPNQSFFRTAALTTAVLFSVYDFSRAQTPVSVTNASFELDSIEGPNAPTFQNLSSAPTGWTFSGIGTKGLLAPGTVGGTSFYSTTSGVNGTNVYFAVGGGALKQTLSATLKSNTVYTLTTALGNRSGNAVSGWGGLHINLSTASGKLVGDWTGFNGHITPPGSFGDSKRTFVSGPNPVGLGEQLVLTLSQERTSGGNLYLDADNIRLTESPGATQTNGTPIDVLIVAGQSNTKGNGAYTGALRSTNRHYADAPNTNVLFSYKFKEVKGETIYSTGSPGRLSSSGAGYDNSRGNYDGFGPELSMGTDVADQLHPPGGFAIIKYAEGGASLDGNFKKSANYLYPIMTNFISQSLQHLRDQGYNPRLKAWFWLQGEADAADLTQQAAVAYGANIKQFVHDVRSDLNAPQMTFILTEINPAAPYLLEGHSAGVVLVNQGMMDLVAQDPAVFFVTVHDHPELLSGFADTVHYTADQQILIGQLWASNFVASLIAAMPAAPSSLFANAVASDQINLSWSDNSTNESTFLIERSTDNANFAQVGFADANQTNYNDSGLAISTTYYYRVRASNSGGQSDYSSIASAATLAAEVLGPPDGLNASVGYAKIYLNWNPVAGAANYNVKRATTDKGPYVTVASPNGTNYTDTGLINGTRYFYVVSAVNSSGEGANSAHVSAIPSGMPIAHYRFDFNTLDSSGHNNDGVPAGALLYGDAKVGGNSAQFDGTSSFVEITRVVTTNFTVAVWIRTTNNTAGSTWYNGNGIVDGESVGNAADWGCSVLNGKFAVGIGNPDTTFYSTMNINDGVWHHVAFTRNSDTGAVKIYIDGLLNFTGTGPLGPRTAPNDLRIGASHSPAPVFLKGNLDDLRFYDEVLPAADIFALASPQPPVITDMQLGSSSGILGPIGNVIFNGSGGNGNAQFLVLSAADLTTPIWTPIATNDFDGNGLFSVTNAFNAAPTGFFRLQLY